MLLLYYKTQADYQDYSILYEPLSPSLGIQAQLPVLLAEYAFYQKQDIADYLNLLVSVEPYFESILAFEQEKSQQGYFMSDTTLDRVLDQCRSFIKEPDSNYMLDIFAEKLKSFGKLPQKEQDISFLYESDSWSAVPPWHRPPKSGTCTLKWRKKIL